MQRGYFRTAWNDVVRSPGWFGKVCVLGLLGLVPVLGPIVVLGYALGWARDIAWNAPTPLPAHVLGNEDGRLYSRGFFALVIGCLCSLFPWLVQGAWQMVLGVDVGIGGMWPVVSLVGLVAFVFWMVGAMRMSVYGRLAPGLQFGRICVMIRHDFGGIARVIGIGVALEAAATVAFGILVALFALICLLVALAVTGGAFTVDALFYQGNLPLLLMLGLMLSIAVLFFWYVRLVLVAIEVLVCVRALGYWTRGFDVPAWRGQDDPMPFEAARAQAREQGEA